MRIAAQRIAKDHGQSSLNAPPRVEMVSQSASIMSHTPKPTVANHVAAVTGQVTPRSAITQSLALWIALVTFHLGRNAATSVVVASSQLGSSRCSWPRMEGRNVSMDSLNKSQGHATPRSAPRCAWVPSQLLGHAIHPALEARRRATSWCSVLLLVEVQSVLLNMVMSTQQLATSMIAPKVTSAHQRRPASTATA